ncbi:PTS system galactitol-specific IIA component [Sporomusaceae bacterium BoRhaA]|uniref:PTS sugar transporter subunit IIA n=1 Tax=Pelorhabdus rhamnosifermentans TaxID=2772457 RepID=UPI001C062331|nr:PTS sugar transporter subunit IIA [Pelorhabdus rhamnosifermentans]MBU2700203.1 PTS system galactitol-specific IIA component [Pelorhabdus rhamnosifermentans]
MEEPLNIDKKMIFKIESNGKTREDILSFLAGKLLNAGYVKNDYEKGILNREKTYPTGLLTGGINVAVPHTDCIYVKKSALAVGILDTPVIFKSMDDPDKDIEVSIVIMIALNQPHGQIEMLQKIIQLIQKQDELEKLLKSNSLDNIHATILYYLN